MTGLLSLLFWFAAFLPSSSALAGVQHSACIRTDQVQQPGYGYVEVMWVNEEYRESLNQKTTPFSRSPLQGKMVGLPPRTVGGCSVAPLSPCGTIFTGCKIPLRI